MMQKKNRFLRRAWLWGGNGCFLGRFHISSVPSWTSDTAA